MLSLADVVFGALLALLGIGLQHIQFSNVRSPLPTVSETDIPTLSIGPHLSSTPLGSNFIPHTPTCANRLGFPDWPMTSVYDLPPPMPCICPEPYNFIRLGDFTIKVWQVYTLVAWMFIITTYLAYLQLNQPATSEENDAWESCVQDAILNDVVGLIGHQDYDNGICLAQLQTANDEIR